MDTQSFHDAVALVTKSNSKSGFTTRNHVEPRTSISTAMMLVRRNFTDNLNFYPMDTYGQTGLCSELVPFADIAGHSTGDNVNIIETTPRGKHIPDSKFRFNHGDSIDLAQDHGWNHRSKHKSARKCEPDGHLNEMSITEMKKYPTGSSKMPEIRHQQPDETLLANTKRLHTPTMNSINFQIRALIIGVLILVLTGCLGGGGGGGGASQGTGTASLSWMPPTQDTEGNYLSDLAGYKIYYGTELGNYSDVIIIDNPGIVNYVIENLMGGNTYYFVITAYDSAGDESGYSGVGSKTIPA